LDPPGHMWPQGRIHGKTSFSGPGRFVHRINGTHDGRRLGAREECFPNKNPSERFPEKVMAFATKKSASRPFKESRSSLEGRTSSKPVPKGTAYCSRGRRLKKQKAIRWGLKMEVGRGENRPLLPTGVRKEGGKTLSQPPEKPGRPLADLAEKVRRPDAKKPCVKLAKDWEKKSGGLWAHGEICPQTTAKNQSFVTGYGRFTGGGPVGEF